MESWTIKIIALRLWRFMPARSRPHNPGKGGSGLPDNGLCFQKLSAWRQPFCPAESGADPCAGCSMDLPARIGTPAAADSPSQRKRSCCGRILEKSSKSCLGQVRRILTAGRQISAQRRQRNGGVRGQGRCCRSSKTGGSC